MCSSSALGSLSREGMTFKTKILVSRPVAFKISMCPGYLLIDMVFPLILRFFPAYMGQPNSLSSTVSQVKGTRGRFQNQLVARHSKDGRILHATLLPHERQTWKMEGCNLCLILVKNFPLFLFVCVLKERKKLRSKLQPVLTLPVLRKTKICLCKFCIWFTQENFICCQIN